ncbi:hypothetical protein EV363DRAFT_1402523 [Boletus edulis]|nr:hypothetical protein EV363DRAFT_1402523 [Boletus edulis]
MAQNASVPVGAVPSKSELRQEGAHTGPTAREAKDVDDLITNLTNIRISNSTLVFLFDEELARAGSESSTNSDEAAADTTLPPSPSPSADSDSSAFSEFDIAKLPTVPTVTLNNPTSIPALDPLPPHRSSPPQDWYRIYRGYHYCVPAPTAPPPYYMVTKGLHVGIVSGWEVAAALTSKVSGSVQRRVPSVEHGYSLFERALDGGNVEVLTVKKE